MKLKLSFLLVITFGKRVGYQQALVSSMYFGGCLDRREKPGIQTVTLSLHLSLKKRHGEFPFVNNDLTTGCWMSLPWPSGRLSTQHTTLQGVSAPHQHHLKACGSRKPALLLPGHHLLVCMQKGVYDISPDNCEVVNITWTPFPGRKLRT